VTFLHPAWFCYQLGSIPVKPGFVGVVLVEDRRRLCIEKE
jgi:hypothetical protein